MQRKIQEHRKEINDQIDCIANANEGLRSQKAKIAQLTSGLDNLAIQEEEMKRQRAEEREDFEVNLKENLLFSLSGVQFIRWPVLFFERKPFCRRNFKEFY